MGIAVTMTFGKHSGGLPVLMLLRLLLLSVAILATGSGVCAAAEIFSAKRVLNQLTTLPAASRYRLEFPFELLYGPDDFLYVTERVGKVSRIDPRTGARRVLLTLSDVYLTLTRNAAGTITNVGQDGLMGMALHPNFGRGTGQDFVFLAYVYDLDPGPAIERRARIVRYWYSGGTAPSLRSRLLVLEGLPAGSDHSSGRLVIDANNSLYYTVGDLGGNQFGNKCYGSRSQLMPTATDIANRNYASYTGKILRVNMNGSIPSGNPSFNGVRSHIFTIGHRNAQGLAFESAPVNGYPMPVNNARLYSSEHGPRIDDEINLISAGRNYGWPLISGYQEDGTYTYFDYSSTGAACNPAWDDNLDPATLGITGQPETAVLLTNFTPPLRSLYPACTSSPNLLCDAVASQFLNWPTVAPSSLEYYGASAIPGWASSLLLPTLKRGILYRLPLNATKDDIAGDPVPYFEDGNRYRDVAVNKAGDKIYLLTDTRGATSGPTAGTPTTLNDPGSVLEYTYLGSL